MIPFEGLLFNVYMIKKIKRMPCDSQSVVYFFLLFVFEVLLNVWVVFAGISVAAEIILFKLLMLCTNCTPEPPCNQMVIFPLYTTGCPKYARFLIQGHIIYEKFAIKPLAIIKLN